MKKNIIDSIFGMKSSWYLSNLSRVFRIIPLITLYDISISKGAYISYVGGVGRGGGGGGGGGSPEGFTNFSKNFHNPGDHWAKYFMAQ